MIFSKDRLIIIIFLIISAWWHYARYIRINGYVLVTVFVVHTSFALISYWYRANWMEVFFNFFKDWYLSFLDFFMPGIKEDIERKIEEVKRKNKR